MAAQASQREEQPAVLVSVNPNLKSRKSALPASRSRAWMSRQRRAPAVPQCTCPACGQEVYDLHQHLMDHACPGERASELALLLCSTESAAHARGLQVEMPSVLCSICEHLHPSSDVTALHACGHCICEACAREFAQSDQVADCRHLSELRCPVGECDRTVVPGDVRSILPGHIVEAIEARAVAEIVANLESKATCPYPGCGHVVVLDAHLEEGDVADAARSDRHRIRCAECLKTFCAACHAAPYHDGESCVSAVRRANSLRCRICDDEVPLDAAGSGGGGANQQQGSAGPWHAHPQLPMDVCCRDECRETAREHCGCTIPECGHPCYLSPGDTCGACLVKGCTASTSRSHPTTCSEDLCGICFVDELRAQPCVVLPCGHAFHEGCIAGRLRARWPGHRITFGFMACPTCGADVRREDVQSPVLAELMDPAWKFRAQVEELVVLRAKREGIDRDAAVSDPSSDCHNDLARYGMRTLAFYECFKCGRPYFGGYQRCEAAMDDGGDREAADRDRHELICGGCASSDDRASCPAHGTTFIEYKCKFCCNIATYYCWGKTHFCSDCHARQDRGEYLTRKPLSDIPECPAEHGGVCPLGVPHPRNGAAEFALGCSLCRERLPTTAEGTDGVPDGDVADGDGAAVA